MAGKPKKEKNSKKVLNLKPKLRKEIKKKEPQPVDPAAEKIKAMKAERKPRLKEMKMLEEGVIPEKNKIGKEFKGKNKVIIA
jgi:hypothetical protein